MKNPAHRRRSSSILVEHPIRRQLLFSALIMLLLGVSACTNSPMLVRLAYERFPSHVSSELSSFAHFDKHQVDWIENASIHHHNWHRTTQLPRYVAMLENLAYQVKNDKTLNLEYVESLISQSRELITEVNLCNPALFATDEMKSLSDRQVDQIRQNLQNKLSKRQKDYTSKNREQRSKNRFKRVIKTLSYVGLDLNELQKELLRKTIGNQVSLGLRRFELTELWNMEFIYLLENRADDEFTTNMQSHIAKRWQLIESKEADIWADTHNNWRNFAAELMESLSDQQRKEFSAWLSKMGRTLKTLANEKIQTVKSPSPLSKACSAEA